MSCIIDNRSFMWRVLLVLGGAVVVGNQLPAQSLVLASGQGQMVLDHFRSNAPMVVQARDAAGHPAQHVNVSWAITQGIGTLIGATTETDANGYASTDMVGSISQTGTSYTTTTVTASSTSGTVNFVITTIGGSPLLQLVTPEISSTITAKSGSTVPGAVVARVFSQTGFNAGSPIPNVGVRLVDADNPTGPVPAACNGTAGIVLTDQNGTATCDMFVTGSTGMTRLSAFAGDYQYSPSFLLQVTAGASCTYALSATSQLFGPAGGSGTVNVIAAAGCGWSATSNSAFIAITAGATGTGNGTVTYAVGGTSASRSGTMIIAGQTFTVNQNAGTVPGGLAITSASNLPPGTVGALYSTTLTATGGQTPYTWSISGGSLPPGLALTPSTGAIGGTPITAATYNFSATVRDSVGTTQSQPFAIIVSGGGSTTGFRITNASFPNGVVGSAYQQLLATAGGCQTPFSPSPSFTVTSGSLPTGLSIQTNNLDTSRSIVGTAAASGTFSFTLTARDGCGNTASASFTILVGATPGSLLMTANPASVAFTVQLGVANSPATQTVAINASGGTLTFTATVATASGGSWLISTPASGSTPGNLTAGVANFSTLKAGTYTGSITIASQASNAPVVVQVNLTVLAAATLSISPTAFAVSQAATTGSNVTNQKIVLANGTGSVHFSAFASTSNGGKWLTVSPIGGDTPATITASIESGGLAPDTYFGTITIAPTSGGNQIIAVTLTVTSPAAALVAQPAPVAFTYQQGATPPVAQMVAVTSTGAKLNVAASVSTQSGGNWLFVDPPTASTAANLAVTVNPAGLAPGTYTGKLVINAADASVTALTIAVSLTVSQSPPTLAAVTNAASFSPGPVAPGEIVTLFGAAIGPTNLAKLQLTESGKLDTTVSDTQVLFDGFLAPVVYTSSGQVSVIVPYEVAGNSTANVQVQYLGVRSNTLMVRVIESAPGIFTLDSSGQGAILNEDSSINSSGNGAEPGSVVSIFATGEGQTDPGGVDGVVTGDLLRKPRLGVTVQIGGQNADVLYAGAAPGQPAGLLQVNARVPANVARGSAAPVAVTVGNASSQAGVTVAIKP